MSTAVNPLHLKELEFFKANVIKNPDRLRRQWLGATALDRRKLTPYGRQLLATLGRTPTLLGPLGRTHAEVLHTKVMVWAMNHDELGDAATKAFLQLLEDADVHGVAKRPKMGKPDAINVQGERSLPGFGRADLWLEGKGVVAVEVKVGAEETGGDQVERYVAGCTKQVTTKDWVVLFLTLEDEVTPSGPCLHVTLKQLLGAWLPVAAAGTTGAHDYLARYLSTLAELTDIGGSGAYDDWTVADRRSALDLVLAIPGAQVEGVEA